MTTAQELNTTNNPFNELAGLKEILPVYERKISIKHSKVMPKIEKGYVIPLPCVKYDSGRWEKVTPVYTKTDRGSSVVLATVHHQFTIDGPIAMRDTRKPGLVCFANKDISSSKNLIGFVVTDRMEKSAIVQPIYGTDEELFEAYEQFLSAANTIN